MAPIRKYTTRRECAEQVPPAQPTQERSPPEAVRNAPPPSEPINLEEIEVLRRRAEVLEMQGRRLGQMEAGLLGDQNRLLAAQGPGPQAARNPPGNPQNPQPEPAPLASPEPELVHYQLEDEVRVGRAGAKSAPAKKPGRRRR